MTNYCCFCNCEISEHSQACGRCARQGSMANIGFEISVGQGAMPSFYDSGSETEIEQDETEALRTEVEQLRAENARLNMVVTALKNLLHQFKSAIDMINI